MLTDHLGSVVAITDASGALVSQQRYLPFGGVRLIPNSQSLITDFGYTGQRNLDSAIGLMDYKARFYSPVLNRFIQPDTIVPNPSNPQMFNRFSYVGNNPVNFNDPSGHVCVNNQGGNDEVAMAGNCGGGENPNYSGGLLGPSWNNNDDEDESVAGGEDNYDIIIDMLEGAPSNQEACEFLLSGASLVCNPETWNSLGDYLSNLDWDQIRLDASSSLYEIGVVAQDLALLVDLAGATIEMTLIAEGCMVAGAPGCLAGIVVGNAAFVLTGMNSLETILSGTSLATTWLADGLDDGQTGEATQTSQFTFIAGLMSTDPIIDLGIDGYASGYNHSFFCGITTIMNGNC